METVIIKCKESVNNSEISPLGMAKLNLNSSQAGVSPETTLTISLADGAGRIYTENGLAQVETSYASGIYQQEVALGTTYLRRLKFTSEGSDTLYFPRKISEVGTYGDLFPYYGGFAPGYLENVIDEKFLGQFDGDSLKTLVLSNKNAIDPAITTDKLFDMFPNLELLGQLQNETIPTLRADISTLPFTKCRRFNFMSCLLYGDYNDLPEDMISFGIGGSAQNDELRYTGSDAPRVFSFLKNFIAQMPCRTEEGVKFLEMLNASAFISGIRMTLYRCGKNEYSELTALLKAKIEALGGVFYAWN